VRIPHPVTRSLLGRDSYDSIEQLRSGLGLSANHYGKTARNLLRMQRTRGVNGTYQAAQVGLAVDEVPPPIMPQNIRPIVEAVRFVDQPGDGGLDVARDRLGTASAPTDLNQLGKEIILQWAYEMINRSPNLRRSHQGSYICTPIEVRRFASPAWFVSTDLRGIFTGAHVRSKAQAWEDGFKNFFPPKDKATPADFEHYREHDYWKRWTEAVLPHYSPTDVEKIRKALKKAFDRFSWAPMAQSDRIWRQDSVVRRASDFVSCPIGRSQKTDKLPWLMVNAATGIVPGSLTFGEVNPQHAAILERQEEHNEAMAAAEGLGAGLADLQFDDE
jgi:hypothetical protein